MLGYTTRVLAIADARAVEPTAHPLAKAPFDLTIRHAGEALDAIGDAMAQGQPFGFIVIGQTAEASLVERILSAAPDAVVIVCAGSKARKKWLALAAGSERLFVVPASRDLAAAAELIRALSRVLPSPDAEWSAGADMLKVTFDNMRQGFLLLDDQWRVADFNALMIEIVGYPAGVVRKGVSAYELTCAIGAAGHFGERSVEEAYEAWRQRLSQPVPGYHLSRLLDDRTLEVGYAPYGKGGWVITYKDVSARVHVEEALAAQNERFDAALTNIPHGVCMFDAGKRLILCNDGYRQLYDLPPELTLPGTPLQRILDHRAAVGNAPTDMATYFDVVGEANAAGAARSRRISLQDGRTVRIAHNPMSSGAYVATHEDISQAVRAEEQIRFLGTHDGLTGLPNRSLLRDRIDMELTRIRRGGIFCIHYLDLDNFKSVNDAHGHPIGDLLLKQVAQRLRHCLRETDVLARLGGDEFVILQADIEKPEQAGSLARRLVEAMTPAFDLDGREVYVGVSIGISVSPSDGADVDVLLRNADMAMYRSKSEGRNTYRFFELAMDARLQERRGLELDLRRAVANGEFELYYQPQVDARTEIITGCEALLRWKHPSRGMVSPAEFIPVAEEIGVIVPLGAWVLQQACRDAARWPKRIGVAVNLSSAQFKGLSLVQTVVAALEASGLSPLRLELEITESALLAETESTIATLNQLRALGVRIAMDDFGTGYSSLSYLRSFPFDKIKIDRSFIKDLGEKGDCAAIVKAVASLAAALGMTTTAEGVETSEQLRQIREQGCTEVQGYFFGRPCPADALPDLFQKRATIVAA